MSRLQDPNGAAEDRVRVAGHRAPEEHLAPNFDAVDRGRSYICCTAVTIGQAVGQHLLAVDDDLRIGYAERYDFFGGVEQEFVFSCHGFVEPGSSRSSSRRSLAAMAIGAARSRSLFGM